MQPFWVKYFVAKKIIYGTDGWSCPFQFSFYWAIKSFFLFFSFLPTPKVQIANMTRGQISAREKGEEQLFHQAALVTAGVHTDEYSPERGLIITPHRKWIISAIITRLKRSCSLPSLAVPSRITGVPSASKGQRLKIISLSWVSFGHNCLVFYPVNRSKTRVGAHFPLAWQFWEPGVWQRVNVV